MCEADSSASDVARINMVRDKKKSIQGVYQLRIWNDAGEAVSSATLKVFFLVFFLLFFAQCFFSYYLSDIFSIEFTF